MAQIILKLSEAEKEKIRSAAKKNYQSISAFLRVLGLKKADDILGDLN